MIFSQKELLHNIGYILHKCGYEIGFIKPDNKPLGKKENNFKGQFSDDFITCPGTWDTSFLE